MNVWNLHIEILTFKITDEKNEDEIRLLGKKFKLDKHAGKPISNFSFPKRHKERLSVSRLSNLGAICGSSSFFKSRATSRCCYTTKLF